MLLRSRRGRVVQDSAPSPRASWGFSACRFSAAHRQMRVSGGRRAIRRLTVGARRWSQRPTSNPNGGASIKPRAIQHVACVLSQTTTSEKRFVPLPSLRSRRDHEIWFDIVLVGHQLASTVSVGAIFSLGTTSSLTEAPWPLSQARSIRSRSTNAPISTRAEGTISASFWSGNTGRRMHTASQSGIQLSTAPSRSRISISVGSFIRSDCLQAGLVRFARTLDRRFARTCLV
jgi:hypothetical protein